MKSVLSYAMALVVFSFAQAIGNVGLSQVQANIQSPLVPPILSVTNDGTVKSDKPYTLNGYWAGVAYLDMDKLQEKLAATKDVELQNLIKLQAQMFMSMVSVVNFKPNGTVESELEVNDENNEVVTESIVGRWKVVESRDAKFLVDVLEQQASGSSVTVRKLFQFYEDGEHMASPVETSPELADLNPLIVFERIPEAVMAAQEKIGAPTRDR